MSSTIGHLTEHSCVDNPLEGDARSVPPATSTGPVRLTPGPNWFRLERPRGRCLRSRGPRIVRVLISGSSGMNLCDRGGLAIVSPCGQTVLGWIGRAAICTCSESWGACPGSVPDHVQKESNPCRGCRGDPTNRNERCIRRYNAANASRWPCATAASNPASSTPDRTWNPFP